MKPNQLYDATLGQSVIKCQHRSRLNEQVNEGNEWECFTLKSLINLASHQPLSTRTPLSPYIAALLRADRLGRFIQWPCVPGAVNPVSCPKALSCILYLHVSHASISAILLWTHSSSLSHLHPSLCLLLLLLHHSISLPAFHFFFLFCWMQKHLRPHTVNASSPSAVPAWSLNMHTHPLLNW